jgi:hypothetical protein
VRQATFFVQIMHQSYDLRALFSDIEGDIAAGSIGAAIGSLMALTAPGAGGDAGYIVFYKADGSTKWFRRQVIDTAVVDPITQIGRIVT